jgi:hypothetical protein
MCPPDDQSCKEVAKRDAGVADVLMHVARATMVTPRSSIRVDRGDVGPPSNIKRWENCATHSERSLVRSGCARKMHNPRHPEGARAKCGVCNHARRAIFCFCKNK